MVEKIKALVLRHWDIVVYLFFGVLTTVVNYAIYLPLYNAVGLSAVLSNAVAWVGAVLFAFLTNKPFVFRSLSWKKEVVFPEFCKFVSFRLGSGVLETAMIYVTVDRLLWDGNIWKLIVSVLVVILNYVASKLLVFAKN